MQLTGGQLGLARRRIGVVVAACALLAMTGCESSWHWSQRWRRSTAPQQRSVEELYFEALAKQKPESTLGMEHPPSSPVEIPVLDHPPVLSPESSLPPTTQPAAPDFTTHGMIPLTPAPDLSHLPAQRHPQASNGQSVIPQLSPPTTAQRQTLASPSQIVPVAASSDKLVSEIFTETDVREAVQVLANQAGVAVVLDDTVQGDVTCSIENEPFEQALERVLLPLGMVTRKKGNLYLVGSNDPSSNLFSQIAESIEFRPNHLSAQELIALLPPRHTQYVRMVEKRNLIMIEAPLQTAQSILSQLQDADQPVPQIMIEAVICVVAPEKGLQFGIDWNHMVKVQGLDALNVGISGLSFTGAVSPYGANNAFDDFAVTSAFIKLLAKEGYVTIRAAPRVMAKDGEKAEISIARETFFSIQQANSQFLFNQNIQTVESGIRLILTPAIRGDTIQIQIEKAEVSEDIRSVDPAQQLTNNPYPIINRRNVATTVQVKDRQTIVIGGLVGRQEVNRESRVPVLGDIPLLGPLFRKIERQEQDAEVAIFISPQIVVPTASQSEMLSGPVDPSFVEVPVAVPMPKLTPSSPIESLPTESPPTQSFTPATPTPLPPPSTSATSSVVPQLRVVSLP